MSRSLAMLLLLGAGLGCANQESRANVSTLSGQVKNTLGKPEMGASITVLDQTTETDFSGLYALRVPAGELTVQCALAWLESAEKSAQVEPGGSAVVDFQLTPRAIALLPADKALAEQYNQTYDWKKDKLSIQQVGKPTRGNLERAVYLHNPALFADASGESPIHPSNPPSLSASPTGFSFPLPEQAPHSGQEALVMATVVDKLEETPLTREEIAAAFPWEPGVMKYLSKWNLDQAADLYYATQAIQTQKWGGASRLAAQTVEDGYVHDGKEIWVKLVFEDFLTVGAGIGDDDGDGKKEVFARVTGALYTEEILAKLADYATTTFDGLGLRSLMQQILDDLYSRTNPIFLRTIGVPYEIPGLGTIEYPLAVIAHQGAGGIVNVLLGSP